MSRCPWCEKTDIYIDYHDKDWGVPVFNDNKHFEFIVLESAQAGLNWLTILNRRENYRKAYSGFDPNIVAMYNEEQINVLLNDSGIIRNKLKIEASVNNAKRFLEIQKEFGSFCNYIWSFVNYYPVINKLNDLSEMPAQTELSNTISKELKKRGFKFIGSTIIYSYLQATGLVNDHLTKCYRYSEIIDSYNRLFENNCK